MKKPLLFVTLLVAAQFAPGCKTDSDIMPSSYDALALETGHWEWLATGYQSGNRTPATVGFTRQLVFTANGEVVITHNKQPNKKTAYLLSMSSSGACGSSQKPAPLITFETDSDVPNNDRKYYNITHSNAGQQLLLVGEAACIDGGAYETYQWVAD